jgi:hypothetical protein
VQPAGAAAAAVAPRSVGTSPRAPSGVVTRAGGAAAASQPGAAGSAAGPGAAATGLPAGTFLPAAVGGRPGDPISPAAEATRSPSAGSVPGDVLPPEVQTQLCTELERIMGPLPPVVTGLSPQVIRQLPRSLTDVVPADVLRVVTLECGAPALVTPGAQPRTETPGAQAGGDAAGSGDGSTGESPLSGLVGKLPHTGAVLIASALQLALGLLLVGVLLRRQLLPSRLAG